MSKSPDPAAPARPVFLFVLVLHASTGFAAGQSISRVSQSPTGVEGDGSSSGVVLSADGRFAAFHSAATNLVAGDTNGRVDVFVRDLVLGDTERVSVGPNGVQADEDSLHPSISGDGRYVAFQSGATTLVSVDQNLAVDVFVHDRLTGATERVSVDPAGFDASDGSFSPSISSDGRFVAFHSAADDLVAGDVGGMLDVFVHDRMLGVTELVSRSATGSFGDSDSWAAMISADGMHVAFQSLATDLVAGDTNGWSDVFVHERSTGLVRRVSLASSGAESNSASETPAVSSDGRFVAFGSYATNLDPTDSNTSFDVFVHDLATGVTERVSRSAAGCVNDGWSQQPSISADGRYVAFRSHAENLIDGDSNRAPDVFVFDRWVGALELAGRAATGVRSDGATEEPFLAAGGRFVGFASTATNLVQGDSNGERDVFVVDRQSARSSFCHGDGLDPAVASACPCSNTGARGHGCANSADARGALLAVVGAPAADDVRLFAARMPASAAGIFLQGDALTDSVFGDGVRCTGGVLLRLRTRSSVAGASSFPDATDSVTLSARGGVSAGSGVRRYYQTYYRNSAPRFCPPATFNVTNGLVVDW